ncbi:MAG: hypothetical protein JOZ69_00485, partial [Myxococcales bacterium]|nr:hypothetical protein [Myxococcales bacterium]
MTLEAGPLPQFPLYYVLGADGSSVVACSRLEPLATLFPRAPVNARRLVSLIGYGHDTDTAATPFAGIQRLRSCESVSVEHETARLARDFPRIAGVYRRGKVEDLAAELRGRLESAVARGIEGAARAAVFVSGGLDSSGVLALAAARARQEWHGKLDAIAVQYAGPGDDRPHLADLTRALSIDPVRLRPEDAAPWFERSLCMDAQPGNIASTCLLLMTGVVARERGADVVLTGLSGDTVSGGALPFARLGQLARRGRVLTAAYRALRLHIPWPMSPALRLRYAFSALVPRGV